MRSIEWIVDRATASRNVQAEIVSFFLWPERTVAQWDADLTAIAVARLAELKARVVLRSQAENLDNTLAQIEGTSRKIVRLGKTRYRNQRVNLAMFESVDITGVSRDATIREGREVLETWLSVEAAWEPSEDLTSGSFGSLLAAAEAQQILWLRKHTEWRRKALIVEDLAVKLDDLNVAWYSDATAELPEGTVAGNLVRTVPTTYNPPPGVGQAVLSNLMVTADGAVHFDAEAPHATRMTYLHKGPGMQEYEVVVADTTQRSLTYHHALPGLHLFKAFGENSGGAGADSPPLTVEVQAQANVA